jgi:cytochrome c
MDMKKMFFALTLAAACFACNGPASSDTKPVSTNDANGNSQIGGEAAKPANDAAKPADATATTTTAAASGKDGKALIEGSDCRTCHKDDAKLIGPAYQDVAKKYSNDEATVKTLADKVKNGGSGNWGQIPMAGHPALSLEDAEAMVRYILSMKK